MSSSPQSSSTSLIKGNFTIPAQLKFIISNIKHIVNIQLNSDNHAIWKLQDLTVIQYLAHVKALVDNIAATGSHVEQEDIILHILNGLSSSYNAFKIAIRTRPSAIMLDELYSLLLSEEINIQNDHSKEAAAPPDSTAMVALKISANKNSNAEQARSNRGKFSASNRAPSSWFFNTSRPSRNPSTPRVTCQLCNKVGHSTAQCWHRTNLQ
ncbi:uncharacterized protein LOC110094853 [Dendrobium catenatum]|uniref:uncharacterized protein LOC110094853 n=1 Tax=Dendrobium catenatum TaxID=906689 RepID=UPI0009F74159|nr:uncharacterized protein LOC110094853 [Dendrobium catenatum]